MEPTKNPISISIITYGFTITDEFIVKECLLTRLVQLSDANNFKFHDFVIAVISKYTYFLKVNEIEGKPAKMDTFIIDLYEFFNTYSEECSIKPVKVRKRILLIW